MAHHKRRNGRSQFIIAQNVKGLLSNSDDSFLGTVTANLMGSKYQIWDQVHFFAPYMHKIDLDRSTINVKLMYY